MTIFRDMIQSALVGLLWWYCVPISEKISKNPELLSFAKEWCGSFGVLWVESLRWTLAPFLCGFLLNAMKRLEILARMRKE